MTSWGKRDEMIVHEQDPFNAEAPPGVLVEAFVTPVSTFYSRNHGPIPELDPDAWSLRVDGAVSRPLTLTLAQLRAFEAVTVTATLQCAGNRRADLIKVSDIPGEDPWGRGATSTAEWTGARLSDVLAAAGLDPAARAGHVAFDAPDVSQLADPPQPYGGSVPLGKAQSPEVLLAWAMNSEPLTQAHGAPVRVVVPGYIGARSVKWVRRVTVQSEPSDNYFQATAYRIVPPDADPKQAGPGNGISLGPVVVNAAILAPSDGSRRPAGRTEVSGYAYAGGDRTVARVDVSTDGGSTWVQADLGRRTDRWAWTMWSISVDLASGPHTLVVRAWDDAGAQQPESATSLWNPKGYANTSWDRVEIVVDAA
ncbi:sulfite oxidase [Microlunatus sagamiharensis]|uniref:sulfite oxidase n=1 Tax=Microlunatus sagamiharensis TaxID=546874 RepID=UPI0018D31978|nr:sulfite oxidase [Microlunatus sagamiharensis]